MISPTKIITRATASSGQDLKSPMFFYEGGGRSKVRNQILHCVKFSPGVIALTGPTGCGKTSVIQSLYQFFRDKDEKGELCWFSDESAVLETTEELYLALAEGFGLEEKSVEMLEDLVDRVQQFIRVGLRARRTLLIIVDDVNRHSEEVLGELLQLEANNKGLNLLLSGESSLLETLKQFHVPNLLMHQITLRHLLTEEVFDFLRQYLIHQGISDESMLDRKKLDELMSRTGGNLSLLAREIRLMVASLQTNNKRTALPIIHVVAFVLVIGITTLAFLYFPASPQPESRAGLQNTPASTAVENIPEMVMPPAAALDGPRHKMAEVALSTAVDTAKLDLAPESIPIQPDTSPYTQQEQVLLNKPKGNLTLQVSSLTAEKMVQMFIQQNAAADAAQMSYYRRGTKDKPSYVVVYGDYSNKQQAMAAQQRLPEVLKKSAPWPRSYADIQQELKQRP